MQPENTLLPTDSAENGRLRVPPQERFRGDHRRFDLEKEWQQLRAEDHSGSNGRRQVTLWHHGPFSQVLLAFEAGGDFPRHQAHAWVSIQVLIGRINVDLPDHSHELTIGSLLVLDPDIPHSLHALEESAVLLTVQIEVEGKPTPLTLGPNEL
jgi:quercetin dioxygenase-like cupin family protein